MEIKVKSQSKGPDKDVSYYTPAWISCKETRKMIRLVTRLEQPEQSIQRAEEKSCVMHEMYLKGNELYKRHFRSVKNIGGVECDVCQGNGYCPGYKQLIKR